MDLVKRATKRDRRVQRVRFTGTHADDDDLIRRGGEDLAIEDDPTGRVLRRGAGLFEIELAAIGFDLCCMVQIDRKVSERLVCLGEETLHLPADLVGLVVVVLLQYGTADIAQMIARIKVVAVNRSFRTRAYLH